MGPGSRWCAARPPRAAVPERAKRDVESDDFSRLGDQAQTLTERLQAARERIAELEEGRTTSSVVATVEGERCLACGSCLRVCPEGAISMGDTARVDPKICTGCGVCIPECPENALSLARISRA